MQHVAEQSLQLVGLLVTFPHTRKIKMQNIKHIVSSQVNAHVMPVGYWANLEKCKEEAQTFANKNNIKTILSFEGDLAKQETGSDKNHTIEFLPQKKARESSTL